MQQHLFRQEAVEFQFAANQGETFVLPSLSTRLLIMIIFVWVIALGWYLNTQQYKTFTRVSGWLETTAGSVLVYPDNLSGRISKLMIENGDIVNVGDPLLQIDSGQTLDNGEAVHSAILNEYLSQQSRLQQQLEDLATTQLFSQRNLRQRIAELKNDITRLSRLTDVVAKRVSLARASEQSVKKLSDAQLLSQSDHRNAASTVLTLEQERLEYQREYAAKTAQLNEAENEFARLPAQHRQERLDIEHQLSNLKNQILQWDSQHKRVITASISGQVTDLDTQVGEYISSTRPLLSIIPENGQLHGKLLLTAQTAGQVEPGQPVRIKLDAFPYQQFGVLEGTITRVADDVMSAETRQRQPIVLNEPAYLIEVQLSAQSIGTFGELAALRSGMTFSADVTTRESSFIDWLLSPLHAVKGAW